MATEKVSLSLDREVLKEARAQVGRRGLSSYVDSALRLKLQHDRLRSLLDDLDAEHGPVDAHILEDARREWPESGKPKRRSR